jgi:hypothetical protein
MESTLIDHILITKEVTNKSCLNKLLLSDLGYRNLTHLKTSLHFLEKL